MGGQCKNLTGRLIWEVDEVPLMHHEGWHNAQGAPVHPSPGSTIRLWHPVGSESSVVLAWRDRLIEQDIHQPFRQAFREVYLLTAAEEATRVYSNRFAAHIIKQHQARALMQERGWAYQWQGQWDSHNIPTRSLPAVGLRAEFWVEPVTDQTNGMGIYTHLGTDQVRFYPDEPWADPLPLQEVPPLVFSEIMRDVDLFVGVASVGNDPSWRDQGVSQDHWRYWEHYSFGELGATAQTRKDLLSRLLPRLKLREVASLEGRFLKVKGHLRTYKIHLGSGNILMEPNDQYLCIVPDSKADRTPVLIGDGDRTLSIILSKAFLLAEDHKIKDPTITRQLKA